MVSTFSWMQLLRMFHLIALKQPKTLMESHDLVRIPDEKVTRGFKQWATAATNEVTQILFFTAELATLSTFNLTHLDTSCGVPQKQTNILCQVLLAKSQVGFLTHVVLVNKSKVSPMMLLRIGSGSLMLSLEPLEQFPCRRLVNLQNWTMTWNVCRHRSCCGRKYQSTNTST